MSVTRATPAHAVDAVPEAARAASLSWGVFVTPGIPIVTRDKPPGVNETFFQATASTSFMARATRSWWTPS